MSETDRLPEWKDVSRYTRDGKLVSPSWEWEHGRVRVWIGTGHRHCPGAWVMHCRDLGIDTHELGPDTLPLDEIQHRALKTVLRLIRMRVISLQSTCHAISVVAFPNAEEWKGHDDE